jgi:hypothetical protein
MIPSHLPEGVSYYMEGKLRAVERQALGWTSIVMARDWNKENSTFFQ